MNSHSDIEVLSANPIRILSDPYYSYTKQIIINFTSNKDTASALKYKWDWSHPADTCYVFDGVELMEDFNKCSLRINSRDIIRISVIGHGDSGGDFIFTGGGDPKFDTKIHYSDLANQLMNLIGKHIAVVNLIACSGGRSNQYRLPNCDNGRKSFASKLHSELYLIANRDIPVIARMQDLLIFPKKYFWQSGSGRVWNYGRKMTLKLDLIGNMTSDDSKIPSNYVSKQPGSKVVFYTGDDGYQNKQDAYSLAWKKGVLSVLAKLKANTRSVLKDELLTMWLRRFRNLQPTEIFQCMQNEIDDGKSVLKEYDFCSLYMFCYSYEFHQVQSWLSKGATILFSPHTVNEIVHVRKLSKIGTHN